MAVEDLDLDRDGVTPPPAPIPAQRAWKPWVIAAAVALAIGGGALTRWWTLQRPAATGDAARPAVAGTDVPLESGQALPPLDDMDPFLRTLLKGLSARPELAAWLATDNLIQQMAWTVDRVSHGESPARELKVLAPEGSLSTIRVGRTRRIDESSYARYDGLAAAIASVDPAAVASAYRTIQPRLNEAYGALGRTESTVDVAVQQALDVLISTPIPSGPIEVVEGKGATWSFADPSLERLNPAQKHLLRMGPRNAARVIETLKAVRQRLTS
jgi:hypothetical protein